MTRGSLRPLWVVVPAVLLASCDGGPSRSAGATAPAYGRWESASGFAVTDGEGNWACVTKDDRGEPTHVVAGLATGSGDQRYPRLPRVLFGDALEVPLDPWATVSVPTRSSHPLLVVTTAGYADSTPPRPLVELAEALWNLPSSRSSVPAVVTGGT